MSTLISFSWACCASAVLLALALAIDGIYCAYSVSCTCCASIILSKSPLLLPLPIPFILLLQHDAVHTRLEQRKRQARLPLQLAQSVPNLERRTRCQLVQFACQLFIYISRAYCYSVAFLTCAFYWGSLSLGTKKKRLAPESFRTCIYVCVCITQTEERRSSTYLAHITRQPLILLQDLNLQRR